jgi:peptidoglycan/LPS O-acetylase OafA/YrhL
MIAGAVLAPWGVALIFPLALTYLLLFLAFQPVPGLVRWAKYGDFSYGLYLFAFPVQQLLVRWLGFEQPLVLFVVATPLVLLCAFASWHLIEKPFLSLKPNPRLDRNTPVPVDPTRQEPASY